MTMPFANGINTNASLIIDNPNFNMPYYNNAIYNSSTWVIKGTFDLEQCSASGCTIGLITG